MGANDKMPSGRPGPGNSPEGMDYAMYFQEPPRKPRETVEETQQATEDVYPGLYTDIRD